MIFLDSLFWSRIHIFYDAVSKSYVARIHRASGDVEWHDGFRSVQEAAVAADKLCREEKGV